MNYKLYVCMTDKAMSGWGRSENKISKYVIACDNMDQAKQIERAAHRRREMKYININGNLPYYSPDRYTVTIRHYNDLGGVMWTEGKYRTAEEQEG